MLSNITSSRAIGGSLLVDGSLATATWEVFFLEPPDRTDQSNYRIYFFAVSRLRISSQPKRARTLARPVHSSGDEAVFLG